jgi:hypothetical protein
MSLHVFSLDDSCKCLPLRGASCTISPADISLSIGPSCPIFGCSINISHVMALTVSQANSLLHVLACCRYGLRTWSCWDTKPDTEIEICYVSSYMFRRYICSHHQAGYRTLNKKRLCIDCDTAFLSLHTYI